MNIDINSMLNNLRNSLVKTEIRLSEVRRINASIEDLTTKKNDLKEYITSCEYYKKSMDLLYNVSCREDNKYKKSRLDFLEVNLDSKIHTIFPERGFTSSISFDFKYSNAKADLKLIDENNNIRIPKITEGGMLQQLLGFVSAMTVVECLGANKFFIDEAFAAASSDNKSKVSHILQEYVDKGIQIFLISQSDDIYKDLPKRVFNLTWENGKASMLSVEDS